MQPLDYYQNERRQGESRTENHSHSRRRRIRCTTTTVLLKWQSQHFILTTSLSPHLYSHFLSEKQSFTKHRLGKIKPHITKNGTKSQIQKMQSTKFMQW